MAAPVRQHRPFPISVAWRRARLARRHRLAPGTAAADPVEVARDLVALHSTDPATVFLSAAARMTEPTVAGIEDALYERRTLLRMLGMRRTMFVVPVEDAPLVQAACTDAIAVRERHKLVQHLIEYGVGDSDWLADVERSTLAALARRGSAIGAELSADEPRLRSMLVPTSGKSYDVPTTITTRVLFGLAARGHIVRGRPRGSWISNQYHWAPAEHWLPAGVPLLAAGDGGSAAGPSLPDPRAAGAELAGAELARVELARRWLAAYGPGTPDDLRWWTGWTVAHTRAALAALDTVPVDLAGEPGVLLAADRAELEADPAAERETDPAGPWVALLPALDPTVMGWTRRDWYLGPHGPALFDRSGNPGPTVWCDGRIVGGWAQRRDGPVVVRLLEDIGTYAAAAVDAAAERLAGWLRPVVVTPRFRTPLERELSG